MRRTGRSALLVCAAVLTVTGCGGALQPAPLAASFAEVFTGVYATQQATTGRTDVLRDGQRPAGDCHRTGAVADGPGDDWTCTVRYVDLGTPGTQAYEVQLRPDGCWTATGAPAMQPPELLDATGQRTPNPLAVLDGCLDTSWH